MQRGFFNRNWVLGYVVGALIVALGIFIMFQQDSFLRVFVVLLGLFITISSALQLVSLASYRLNPFFHRTTLVRTIISIIIGLVAIVVPMTVATVSWTVMLYVIAAVLGLSAVITLIDAMVTVRGGHFRPALLGDGLFSLAVSILLFAFPEQIGTILLKVVGLLIIVSGLGLVVVASRGRALSKRAATLVIEGEGEVMQ